MYGVAQLFDMCTTLISGNLSKLVLVGYTSLTENYFNLYKYEFFLKYYIIHTLQPICNKKESLWFIKKRTLTFP